MNDNDPEHLNGDERRYLEYVERQKRLKAAHDAVPHVIVDPHDPHHIEAEKRYEKNLIRQRHARMIGTVVFVIVVIVVGVAYWRTQPRILPVTPDPGQIEWARDAGYPLALTNSFGMVLRLIPPGTFVMGSRPKESGHRPDEVQHTVNIFQPFYLAEHEVTQSAYEQIMGTNCSFFAGAGRLPVDSVTWEEAVTFCNELSRLEGLPVAYEFANGTWRCNVSCDGYRLPFEAEWEYACRAGTVDAFYTGPIVPPPDGRRNLWRAAWFRENADGHPHEVGLREPNAWGLYDMLGNLREWVWDRYANYPITREFSLTGPVDGIDRVVRGGGWYAEPERTRCAARRRWPEDIRWNSVGFRVARSAHPLHTAK